MLTQLKHSGFVGIIGRPNVGKSTLLNTFAKQKIAIVSSKPQTTRHQIKAVVNLEDAQIIFIDTPGFHRPKDPLGERLNAKVRQTLAEVDLVLFLVDGFAGIGKGDEYIASELKKTATPLILGINKADLLPKDKQKEEIKKAQSLSLKGEIFLISALTGYNLKQLLEHIKQYLPAGPQYYPPDMVTDQPELVLIAEFIREKVYELTREEIPYAVAVEVTEVKPVKAKELLEIYARIIVERNSQKGIIIGHQGQLLKEIGSRARRDLERLLGTKIYLDLLVTVKKDWRKQERTVAEFGY
jgi:GTP-binding protein Era